MKQAVEAFLSTQHRMANMRPVSEVKAKPEPEKEHHTACENTKEQTVRWRWTSQRMG